MAYIDDTPSRWQTRTVRNGGWAAKTRAWRHAARIIGGAVRRSALRHILNFAPTNLNFLNFARRTASLATPTMRAKIPGVDRIVLLAPKAKGGDVADTCDGARPAASTAVAATRGRRCVGTLPPPGRR